MVTGSHFILYVRDQIASRDFYARVLDRGPALDVPGMTEFQLTPGVVLGIMPESAIARLLGPPVDPTKLCGAGRAELYLVVDDPAAYHARALAAGGQELSPLLSRDWGHRAAYSLDRDGHVVAFADLLA
ncbi:MAG: hypothetical protein U0169_10950 [Polyangiaceae bacterium]